jgi:fumarylpyruvate hydrolase
MGHDPDREPPFFFMKPADAVIPAEGDIAYPPLTEDLHHEIELVVAIGKDGVDIAPEDALSHVWGYAAGVDLTRRDIQAQAKKMGRPWDWAKGFDGSGPSSPLVPVSTAGHPEKGAIWLKVNGVERQRGDLSDQIWSVKDVISYISQSVTLKAGDLIFTGTPAGVGALQVGDVVSGGIEGVSEFAFTVSAR